jgi:diphthamide synthase (EF-2-diphthine--ammonia ligase)
MDLHSDARAVSARPVVLAWSGGKDSSLAHAAVRADPAVDVVAVLTTITRDYDRISIHGVPRAVLEARVAALGLPLIEVSIPARGRQLNERYQFPINRRKLANR